MTEDVKAGTRAASEPLEALLDEAVDAIIISDSRGDILRFNAAAQKIFGYTESEALGQNLEMLMPQPHRRAHRGYLQRYIEGGEAAIIGVGREVTGLRSDGTELPIHLSVGEIHGTEHARFVGIIRDLTAEKQAHDRVRKLESQLAHADRLVVLGELMAGIAHEINQPLTAISAFSDAGARLLQFPGNDSDLESICRQISKQASRAGDVVKRLRTLVRRGEPIKETHRLNELLSGILQLFEHELAISNVILDIDIPDDLPELRVDGIQIQQVLVNLLKNSLDSLVESQSAEPRIRVLASADARQVSVTVSDNGPGVPADQQVHLFEPFYTTKEKGVGLGLSICRNIAVTHGGSLRYVPGGEGASFTLMLPLDHIG